MKSFLDWLKNLHEGFEVPLSERDFLRHYAQHIDIRGSKDGTAQANRESILRGGFKKGINVNALPPSRGGAPNNVMDMNFMPKAGDVVYLAPKGAWKNRPNGMEIQDGWVPKPWEVITVGEEDLGKSMYELYVREWMRHNRP